ncbi:MAG: hypothetical protein AB1390_11635 [Nitrospirota bacterium]
MADEKKNGDKKPVSFLFSMDEKKYYDKDLDTAFFVWNANDSNENGIQDRWFNDRFDKKGNPFKDPDLLPLYVKINNFQEGRVILDWGGESNDKIRVFKNPDKTGQVFLPWTVTYCDFNIYVEGIGGSKKVGDVVLTLTRKDQSWQVIEALDKFKLTVVPLIAVKGKDELGTTSLYDVCWKPDGSYALLVGDRATVVKYTPKLLDGAYKSPEFLKMEDGLRDNLDALKIHSCPTKPEYDNRSSLNRFDRIIWIPPLYGDYPLIVGGAWAKGDANDYKTDEIINDKRYSNDPDKPAYFPTLFEVKEEGKPRYYLYYGGACVLSYHDGNNATPFQLVKTKTNDGQIVDYRGELKLENTLPHYTQPDRFDKFWDVAWQPNENMAAMVGESKAKFFLYQKPAGSNVHLLSKYALNISDLTQISWYPPVNGVSPYALATGDSNVYKYNPNSDNPLNFDVNKIYDASSFFNADDGSFHRLAWEPGQNHYLVAGQKRLYFGPFDDLPTHRNFYELSETIRSNGQKVPLERGINGICWQPDGNYAILTGGVPQDIQFIHRFDRKKFELATVLLFCFVNQDIKVVRVRHSFSVPLSRVQWKPGSQDNFALTGYQYRQ